MIKLVALDMDGTTLNSDGHISVKNRELIAKAMEHGIHVAIASGRAYSSLPREVLEITGIEYAIASNGANIYRVSDDTPIMQHLLTRQSVEQILNVVSAFCLDNEYANLHITMEAFVEGVPYTDEDYYNNPMKYGASQWAASYVRRTRHPVENIEDFIRQHICELDCIDIVISDTESEITDDDARVVNNYDTWTEGKIDIPVGSNHNCTRNYKEELIDLLNGQVEDIFLTHSVKTLIEISNYNAGKGKALKYLADFLGINLSQTCGMGDQNNDLELLEASGFAVAMGNAVEELKEVADYITKSNNEDGVAYALEYIMSMQ